MTEDNGTKTIGSGTLMKGLNVLITVASSEKGMTLTEISRTLDINKATALRMLRSLESMAFLRRLSSGAYFIGPAALQLNFLAEQELYLHDIVLPAMQEITEETGEATSFFVIVRNERMCVAVVPGRHRVSDNTQRGEFYSLDRGSAGRALTAYRDGWNGVSPLQAFVAIGERDPELAGISSAIFNPVGDLIGAISIAGTVQRFSPSAYVDRLKSILLDRCKAINRKIRLTSPLDDAVQLMRGRRR